MTSAPAPSADAEFLMTLRAGVDAADLAEAKDLVRAALGVTEPFVFREDGGVYYAYEPNPAPQDGIGGAHVYEEAAPQFTAEIDLVGRNLLLLGRTAIALAEAGASVSRYVVAPRSPGAGGDLWRAHVLDLPPGHRPSADVRYRGPLAATARGRPAPVLSCLLVLAVQADGTASAAAAAARLFGLELEQGYDPDVIDSYGAVAGDAAVAVDSGRTIWGELFSGRDTAAVLRLAWQTPSLLDLGAVAMAVERNLGLATAVLAYRAVGDLVRDGVPRVLVGTRSA
jgi:hypothetical protein